MKIAITCHPIAGQQIAATNRTVYEIQDHSLKIRQKTSNWVKTFAPAFLIGIPNSIKSTPLKSGENSKIQAVWANLYSVFCRSRRCGWLCPKHPLWFVSTATPENFELFSQKKLDSPSTQCYHPRQSISPHPRMGKCDLVTAGSKKAL